MSDIDDWKSCGIVFSNQPIDVDGVNPWPLKWIDTGRPQARLPHPAYPHQRHEMNIYQVKAGGRTITFAAGELSNGVWGFYLPV